MYIITTSPTQITPLQSRRTPPSRSLQPTTLTPPTSSVRLKTSSNTRHLLQRTNSSNLDQTSTSSASSSSQDATDSDTNDNNNDLSNLIYTYQKPPNHPRIEAPTNAIPIIILPGFGNNTGDYTAPFGDEQSSLVTALKNRGFTPYVLPVNRKDWFNVGKMIFNLKYYSQSCCTRPGYLWYLNRVKELVDTARLECKTDQVDIIGHSAGGWLGRAFLGQLDFKDDPLSSTEDDPHEGVRSLITLGSPHTPPDVNSGQKDMTGGALTFTNDRWPGAFYKDSHGVKYNSVAGKTVVGSKAAGRKTLPGYASGSYAQVAGQGDGVYGDGVVPLSSAILEGSEEIVLEGVYHSMSRISTFDEPSGTVWYGSDEVVDVWLKALVE